MVSVPAKYLELHRIFFQAIAHVIEFDDKIDASAASLLNC